MPLELLPAVAATIARVTADLPPGATLSPRTLAAASTAGTARQESLPRISLGGELGTSTDLADTPDLEVLGLLGQGGLGRVMLARQRSVGRQVAVKVAHDREQGSAALREEARTMGRLEHPNVVPVHAIGVDDQGGVVLVMKRVEGVDWHTLLRDRDAAWWARLEVPVAERMGFHVDVLAQVANALHYAHAHGVIHCDVKPENVLIGAHGDVYLADWGVASLPDQRMPDARRDIMGTPAYMAPEMVLGDATQIDVRTDVFLLGATLHEILIGRPRYPGDSIPAVLLAAYQCEPFEYPDGVPRELAALASAATSREPSLRPESALAFRRALDAWRVHRGAIALAERAQQIANEARVLRASGGAAGLADVDRMLIEARFGFTQALREWPEQEAAQRGLRDVLVLAVETDVARQSVHTVRARLAEISDPPADLVAAVEKLEASHASDRAERERLEALERDRDLSVDSAERRKFFGVVLSTGLCIATFVRARSAITGQPAVDHVSLAAIAGLVLVPAIGFGVVMRRRGGQNAAGESLLVTIIAAMSAVLANRVIGGLTGTPIHALLATDCVIYALAFVAMRPVVPRIAVLAPWLALGAIGCMAVPRFAAAVFAATVLTMLLALFARWSWFMRIAARR